MCLKDSMVGILRLYKTHNGGGGGVADSTSTLESCLPRLLQSI